MLRNVVKILSLALLLAGVVPVAEGGWEEGVAALRAGNLDQAASEFKSVVDAQPEFAGGQYMLGQVLLKQGKKSDALTHARKAYELEPGNISYQFLLGQAYVTNGRYNEAVQVLNKINPSSLAKQQQGLYQQLMVVALDKTGRTDESLKYLRQMAQSNPNDSSIWFSYGTAALNADQLDQGISAVEKAISLDGSDPKKKEVYIQAMVRKARITRDSAQKKAIYAKAVPVARSLVSSSANHGNLLLLAEVQLGAAQFQDAVRTLQQAVSKNSNDFYTHFYTAQAQTSLKNWSAAETAARQALQVASQERDKNRAWSQIGFINEKMKKYDDAILAYQKAGDQVGLQRVEENQRIANENKAIEEHNQEIEELRRQEEELEKQLKELEGGKPPRR
jgi:tetratricopeptide (TPR) repeat protein